MKHQHVGMVPALPGALLRTCRAAATAVLCLSLYTGAAVAQESKDASAEKKSAATPTDKPAPAAAAYQENMSIGADKNVGYGNEASFLTWHGYLNFEFDKKQKTNSNFDNHEFYLSAQARVADPVTITAEFEYEHNPEVLVLPIQAYVDYAVRKEFNVRTGLFFTPMGIPRSYNLRGNKNRMIRQVAVTHDVMFENWAEVGIDFFGQFKNGFFYDVAIANGMPGTMGTGDSWFDATDTLVDHTEDNNNNKALHSRFGYQTDRLGGVLNAAISMGTQKYDTAATRQLIHRGFDVRYLHRSGWRVQSEFMRRGGDDNPANLAKGISARAQGWYTQLSKRILLRDEQSYLEPVFQFDSIDLNRGVKNNGDQLTSAVGLVFSPVSNYLVKCEYDFVKERYGTPLHNNMLWLAVVVEF